MAEGAHSMNPKQGQSPNLLYQVLQLTQQVQILFLLTMKIQAIKGIFKVRIWAKLILNPLFSTFWIGFFMVCRRICLILHDRQS